jgi:PAS domain S-box-containing protein
MKLRAGIQIFLVIALALFALAVGIGSAVLELATVTRVEVESAVSRAELAGHLVLSQLAITLRDSTGHPVEAMRNDARLASVIADAQELTPSVLYILIADTGDSALLHSVPRFQGRLVERRPLLEGRVGVVANLRQFSSILNETGAYEVSIPLLLNGRDFATVRVGLAASLLREELLTVFRSHLVMILIQVLLAMALGIAVSWLVILRPLARIEKGIRQMQKGDFTYRLPANSGNELGQLAGEINSLSEMLARERETFASQRDSLVTEGETLRSIVDAVDDGLFMVDRDQRLIMSNRTAARLLGVDLAGFVGKSLDAALNRNHPLLRLVEKAFDENRFQSGQIELRTPSGDRVFLVSCQTIGDASNQQGAIVSIRDYGRMREVQELLDHARVLSRLSKMAAGVAHEVRNPLHSMTIHLELLREKMRSMGGGSTNGQDYFGVVKRDIAKVERVVYGFLKLARLDELALASIDVRTLLEEVRSRVLPEARMAGLDILLEVRPKLPNIYGDAEILRQAIMNLVVNAIQASPAGSQPIRICAEADNGVVQFTVEDRGPGIDPEVQSRIFDLYFTTKKDSTGVGLSLVQQAIEMHGGSVTVQSSPEAGTIFTIRLPALTSV